MTPGAVSNHASSFKTGQNCPFGLFWFSFVLFRKLSSLLLNDKRLASSVKLRLESDTVQNRGTFWCKSISISKTPDLDMPAPVDSSLLFFPPNDNHDQSLLVFRKWNSALSYGMKINSTKVNTNKLNWKRISPKAKQISGIFTNHDWQTVCYDFLEMGKVHKLLCRDIKAGDDFHW